MTLNSTRVNTSKLFPGPLVYKPHDGKKDQDNGKSAC